MHINILENIFVVSCPALNLTNGRVSYNKNSVDGGYPVGTEVQYSCNYGYRLSGPLKRYCQRSDDWTGPTAACNPGNQFEQLLNCDQRKKSPTLHSDITQKTFQALPEIMWPFLDIKIQNLLCSTNLFCSTSQQWQSKLQQRTN